MAINLGKKEKTGKFPGDDYEVKYPSQLNFGDTISGEIYIGEVKDKEIKGKPVKEFNTILTDHENKTKYIISIIGKIEYDGNNDKDSPTIYGEKGGRVYDYIDSLENVLNGLKRNEQEAHVYYFNDLRNQVNENVEKVTMKLIQSSHPNARAPNVVFTEAVMQETGEVFKTDCDYGFPEPGETAPKGQQDLTPFDLSSYADSPKYQEIYDIVKETESQFGARGVNMPNVQSIASELYQNGNIPENDWSIIRKELNIE
jgi:hypothetical protein